MDKVYIVCRYIKSDAKSELIDVYKTKELALDKCLHLEDNFNCEDNNVFYILRKTLWSDLDE